MTNKPEYIIIHHSATKDGVNPDWEAIRKYHIEVNGWQDIGYHLGLEEIHGKLFLKHGRKLWDIGAHAQGFNERSIGICLVGNYDQSILSIAKKEFLAKIVSLLLDVYDIPVSRVLGHWETYVLRGLPIAKSCPGNNIKMDELREYLNSRQYTG